MSKFLVITYPDTSLGFSLAGIESLQFKDGENIAPILQNIIDSGEYGLLAIEEAFLTNLPDEVLKRLKKAGIPVIVPIDTPRSWQGKAETESYIVRLIRKAIGYQIKIKR